MRVQTPRVTGIGADGLLEFRSPTPGCDFCGLDLAGRWARFDCRDFVRTIPGLPGFGIRMIGFWAACAPCAPMVRSRSWRQLIDHVTRVRVEAGHIRAGHPEVRSELASLYLELEQHLTGVERRGGGRQ